MPWWFKYIIGSVAEGLTLFMVEVAFHLLIPIMAPVIPQQFRENLELYLQ